MKKMLLLLVLLITVGCSTIGTKNNNHEVIKESKFTMESGIIELSNQIITTIEKGKKNKIAIIKFSNIDERKTILEKYISEELTTKIFLTGRFVVVERNMIEKVMEENKLSMTGIVDEKTAKELGKILGVDAICVGSITDFGTTVKLNARLIATDTGMLFSAASVRIIKDDDVLNLMKPSEEKNIKSEKLVSEPTKELNRYTENFNNTNIKKEKMIDENIYVDVEISSKSAGKIYLNNRYISDISKKDGVTLNQIKSGNYSLRIEYLDGAKEEKEVEVQQQKNIRISFEYTPIDKGLIAYWNFDNSPKDYSGKGNDLIENYKNSNEIRYEKGYINNSIHFTYGERWLSLESDKIDKEIKNELSFSFWIKIEEVGFLGDISNSNDTVIFSNSYPLNSSFSLYALKGNNGFLWKPNFEGNNTGKGDTIVYTGYEIWTHIVLTFDGFTSRFYVNGKLAKENKVGGVLKKVDNSKIAIAGNYGIDTDYRLKPTIDEFRIYNRALLQSEITELFHQN